MESTWDKILNLQMVAPSHGDGWLELPADKIRDIANELAHRHSFNCLSCITASELADTFEIIYHLFSYSRGETIVLKAKVAKDVAKISSIASIYPSANWMEREQYDLMGIVFEGHPDLKRILLPDDWIGHPLRKDYCEGDEYLGMTTKRESKTER